MDHWDIPYTQDDAGAKLDGAALREAFGEDVGDLETVVYCFLHTKHKEFKSRRGTPEVNKDDFYESLALDSVDGRVYYNSINGLNGWPGLYLLHLVELTKLPPKRENSSDPMANPEETQSFGGGVSIWKSEALSKSGKVTALPTLPDDVDDVIVAKLLLPKYCKTGYSKDNPGYVYYYNQEKASICHGKKIQKLFMENVDNPQVKKIQHFGHRYMKKQETARDKKIYHSGVVIEYESGPVSVVELAWRHGVGAYKGQSNWVLDQPAMFKSLPREMIIPWQTTRMELRMTDLPSSVKTTEDFYGFLKEYEGKRFIAPAMKEAYELTTDTLKKSDIVDLLLRRSAKTNAYAEPVRNVKQKASVFGLAMTLFRSPPEKEKAMKEFGVNCQTFSAAFYSYLTKNRISMVSATKLVPKHRVAYFE